MKNYDTQRGFTMVEMALVLVIIGLILGAVSIGRDLQRSAEYKKIKQKFVDQWVVVYNSYYSGSGVVLGDNEESPTLVVNGASIAEAEVEKLTDPQTTLDVPRLCSNSDPSLLTLATNRGLALPPGRAEGKEDRYAYLDTEGNPVELKICFQWLAPGKTASGNGNVMILDGLTPDLARAIDSAIDGRVGGSAGQFRMYADGADADALDWPDVIVDATGRTNTVSGALKMSQ